MAYQTISLEVLEQSIALLKISRPQALNALNSEVMSELQEAVEELKAQQGLRAVVVTGEGEKAFVAGADIKEMQDHTSSQAYEMALKGQKVFSSLSQLPCPVIAAVNGFALGGGMELSLACDFIVASEKARFGLPEVGLGLIPGYGGTQRLSRSVGLNQARYLTFTAEMLSAEQMKQMGLVSEVVPAEELMDRSLKLAQVICSRGPKAVALAKKALIEGSQLSLEQGLAVEAQAFKASFETEDHKEGIKAFVEKRKPSFKGN